MLLLDRYLGFHFFSVDAGGNPMMYVNLFWVWGHPEVYILILPAFGIFSEVIATFSGKPLFGYRSMVAATMAICVLSFLVWLHHFFTMGASANVNGFFGVMTHDHRGADRRQRSSTGCSRCTAGAFASRCRSCGRIGFMVTFVIGGMTGVLMAVPPADFQLHNSLFLVAHFHNVIIGGVVFGVMAGYNYWFPKAFGFTLDERWGKASFWCWFIGFYLAFMPLYVLGLMGMTRRMQHYDNLAWQPWLVVAAVGAVVILAGIVCQIVQLVVSIRDREQHRDVTGDPWNGRTLEWSTASPPPAWNFAVLPRVAERDAYWSRKQRARATQDQPTQAREYEPIEMPKNSATGFVNAFFAVVTGFALIWHIWWMAGAGTARRVRDAPCLRVSRRGGDRDTGRADCPVRSSVTRRRLRYEHRCCHRRCPSRGAAERKRSRSRAKADRRRLRLLDLPPERHRDVLGAVCRLRGARACDRGRSDRRAAVQSSQRRDRDRLSSRLELHVRADVAGGQFAAPRRHLLLCRGHLRARGRVSSLSRSASSPT